MERLFERFSIAFAVLIVALLCMAIGLAAIAVALYDALLQNFTTPVAALLTGIAAFVVTVLLLLIARSIVSRRSRPVSHAPAGSTAATDPGFIASEIGNLIGGHINGAAHKSPRMTFAASLLVGLTLGASPALRNALLGLVREITKK